MESVFGTGTKENPFRMDPLLRHQPNLIKNAIDFGDAGKVAAEGFFSLTEAVIQGSASIRDSLIGMITNVATAIPGVANSLGGFGGIILGGVGGILGALFRRKDPMPVRLEEVSDGAARKMSEAQDRPLRITTVIEQGGVEIEQIERMLYDRQNRDEVVRYSRGRALR